VLKIATVPDSCTLAEAVAYRRQLRDIGPAEFCRRTVEEGAITAKKLLTAFGIRPPREFADKPDEAYYNLLSLAISRELSKRIKIPHYNTIDDAVHLIKQAKNISMLNVYLYLLHYLGSRGLKTCLLSNGQGAQLSKLKENT
jgi:NAD-dependent histone deacetylase SIR2